MNRPPRPPSTTPLRPDSNDPVALFSALVKATKARDFRGATAARKGLRLAGWSVAPCGEKGGAS